MDAKRDPRFTTIYPGQNPGLSRIFSGIGKIALDVGCGCGGTAAWLKGMGLTVDGLTWNPNELKEAAAHCRTTFQCDFNEGLPGIQANSYDMVICSHILEHIAYPQKLLNDIHRALVSAGVVLVAVPNILFWRDRLMLLTGRWEYQDSGTFDYTHVRWYTKESMINLMAEHGFRLESFVADGWLPLPGLRHVTGKSARQKLNEFFCRKWPGLFGCQLLFRFSRSDALDNNLASR